MMPETAPVSRVRVSGASTRNTCAPYVHHLYFGYVRETPETETETMTRTETTDATYTMDEMIRRCVAGATEAAVHLVGRLDRMAPPGEESADADEYRQQATDDLIAEYARGVARDVREGLGYDERVAHHTAESRFGTLGFRPTDGLRRVQIEEVAIAAAAELAVRYAVVQFQNEAV